MSSQEFCHAAFGLFAVLIACAVSHASTIAAGFVLYFTLVVVYGLYCKLRGKV